jgi:hypothetical protein
MVSKSFYDFFRFALPALLGMVLLFSQSASARIEDGHRIIATVADAQLTPVARDEVNRLLAREPGRTLASISTGADQHRNPETATSQRSDSFPSLPNQTHR